MLWLEYSYSIMSLCCFNFWIKFTMQFFFYLFGRGIKEKKVKFNIFWKFGEEGEWMMTVFILGWTIPIVLLLKPLTDIKPFIAFEKHSSTKLMVYCVTNMQKKNKMGHMIEGSSADAFDWRCGHKGEILHAKKGQMSIVNSVDAWNTAHFQTKQLLSVSATNWNHCEICMGNSFALMQNFLLKLLFSNVTTQLSRTDMIY